MCQTPSAHHPAGPDCAGQWPPMEACLSSCSQLDPFQLKDHLGGDGHAARWVPLLLAVHPQVAVRHGREVAAALLHGHAHQQSTRSRAAHMPGHLVELS